MNIKNDIQGFLITIPNPEDSNSNIDIYLTPESKTKISVSIVNGSPYIKVKAEFSGRIRSLTENSNNLDSDVLSNVSTACNKYLESTFSNYLYKTSKDFKSDITGLGNYALSQFLTTSDFDNYDWLNNYQDAFFDVDVDTSVKSSVLIKET